MQAIFSDSLRGLVSRKFTEACARKDVIFSDTQLAVLQNSFKTPIQLRYCPALAKKPGKDDSKGNKEDSKKKPFDPFDNPSPELLVAEIPKLNPSHNIVLNKYPVIPNHFILATKANKPQTHLLESDDLYLTYACLCAWEEHKHALFAFFNSGEHSGASQPHRHLQFLPVEDMEGDTRDAWTPLCTTMTSPVSSDLPLLHNPLLPFVHFAVSLEDHPGPTDMLQKYQVLLRAALAGINGLVTMDSLQKARIENQGKTTFSYNLAMTTKLMVILPRRNESSRVYDTVEDSQIAVNGTILAGTMMVKAEEEWQQLRREPEMVQRIFRDISFLAAEKTGPKTENL